MEPKTVEWQSDRLGHYILSELETMRRTIMRMGLEDILGQKVKDFNLIKNHEIKYKNDAVDGIFPGSQSNISLDSTIALMNNYGTFYVPDIVKQYLKDEYDNKHLNPDRFPNTEELFEKGKEILDLFLEEGYTYYSSCILTGAAFVECAWNVNVVNKTEFAGGGVPDTGGWDGAGEGMFGLTFWSQKEKVIKKVNSMGPPFHIPDTVQEYRKTKSNGVKVNHLSDLDVKWWVKIAKIYLDIIAKKHSDVLTREEEPSNDDEYCEMLSAGYLWKAAGGLDPNFDNVKKTADKYMATHISQSSNPKYQPTNGFAMQTVVAILMDQYLNGSGETTLSLKDYNIDVEFELDIDSSGFDYRGRMVSGTRYSSLENYMAYIKVEGKNNYNAEKYTIGGGKRAEVIKALGFSDNPTESECYAKMKTINIEAYPGRKITVHKDLATEVQGIFSELKAAGVILNERIGGYCFRPINNPSFPGSKTLSMHSFGCAIDINYNLNPFVKNGKPWVGHGDDTIKGVCRTTESPIVQAFAKYGWGWGGRYGDYMHFSKANGS